MKLKQGDYLPVSEVKTEQDFNNVIKAAENCGIKALRIWAFEYVRDAFLISDNGYFVINALELWHDDESDGGNKLTLSQWLERGGVKPEYKEWDGNGLPPVGSKVILQSMGFTEYNKQVEITYIGDGVGCYREVFDTGFEFTFAAKDTIFKPLKSKADQEREEFVKWASEITWNDETDGGFEGAMYDAGCRKVKPLRKEDLLCSPNLSCATTTFGWLRDNGHIVTED